MLVYVDDATGRLMELRFARSESTFDYFESTRSYLGRHGKPVAFYSDRAAIFRVDAKDDRDVVSISVTPDEGDCTLVVDAN